MRKIKFVTEEHYHIFNRGVDKRKIINDEEDLDRFFQSMKEFNRVEPIGSIYENSLAKHQLGNHRSRASKLVSFVCYCINPNHYHFLLKPLVDDGISKFMHRLGTGYTNYFNKKHDRNGVLFQGAFKAILVDSNEYLLHLSAYINLNHKVHSLGSRASKSSWEEYVVGAEGKKDFCEKGIILGQFKNELEYKKFAEDSLKDIKERREEMKDLLLE